jgi:hypothetical protein
MVAARAREQELLSAMDALEEQLRQPRPLSEQELLDGLGEETARLLRSGREAGEEIRKKGEERAARMVDEATAIAESTRAEAEAHSSQLLDTAEARARELASAAEAESDAIVEGARRRGREMLDEAKAARERVLADLVRRRALLQGQIEALRVGRDRLLDAYRTVKGTFLEATEALAQVERDPSPNGRPPSPSRSTSRPRSPRRSKRSMMPPVTRHKLSTSSRSRSREPGDRGCRRRGHARRRRPRRRVRRRARRRRLLFAGCAGHADAPPTQLAAGAPAEETATSRRARRPPDAAPNRSPRSPGSRFPPPSGGLQERQVDGLLGPLVKKTKRTVQDDQNALLDAVRRHKGRPAAAQVLPALDALITAWSRVLGDAVDHAYADGRVAAGGETRDADPELVREAAEAVVAPLRQRVTVAIDSGDEGDTGGLVERIGAVSRVEEPIARVVARRGARARLVAVCTTLSPTARCLVGAERLGPVLRLRRQRTPANRERRALPTGQPFPPAPRLSLPVRTGRDAHAHGNHRIQPVGPRRS